MTRLALIVALPALALASACPNTGANYQPVIDGPVGPNYSNDLFACQQLAASQGLDSRAAGTVATGAGAAAAGTAIIDNSGNNVRDAAIVGAVVGGAAAGLDLQREREQIIRNCMRGRGYNVVG